MRLIDVDALGRLIEPRFLVEALRRGHETGEMGMVERLLLEDGAENAALTWAGWHRNRGIAIKTATVFPENSRRRDRPNIQSVVVLFDAADGRPLAALHGESFTRMKTAADSALAVDLLALPNPATLAVLGAGGQAATQIRFHLAVRPSISRVLIWNRSAEAARRLAAEIAVPGVTVMAEASAEAAVRQAGIVTCVTASREPVLQGRWLAEGTHVDLVGAYTPTMRESDDDVVRRGRLFADSRRFGIEESGDYSQPIAAGLIAHTDIAGDLFDLCSGRIAGRQGPSEITVFKNAGGGQLDLMAARALYDYAVAHPI
jgi:ornithine cyclodeaminase/alanine dehydrogenase-like protein (mu-crystallin family)